MRWNLITTKELKIHYISSKAFEIAINDIIDRHEITSIRRVKVFNLRLDPGGPIDLLGKVKVESFKFGEVSVSEEHLEKVRGRIDKIRNLKAGVVKVYIGPEQCVVLTDREYKLLKTFVNS